MTATTSVAPITPGPAAPLRAAPPFVSRHARELSVAGAYGALLALLLVLRPDFFRNQFGVTWISAAPVLVAAVGMTLVIVARHIDISIGSQFSVCGVLAGLMAKHGVPMPAVALLTLAAGAALGAANGALVALMGLPSIVVTLATMVILRESLSWIRQGEAVYGLPANFQWLGQSQHAGQVALLLAALVVLLAFAWGTKYLTAGRAVYAVGSDQEAARLAGIRPRAVVMAVFVLMGALAGLAAMMNAIRFPQVDPKAGSGLELQVIAAVVVGGAAISGGRGNLIGTLAGVALLTLIGSALVFLHVDSAWERAIQGAIILVAVASDGIGRRGR